MARYKSIDKNDVTMNQDNEGFWMIKHKNPKKRLWFRLRHNSKDNMMQFQIFDGDHPIGSGAQYTANPNGWTEDFVFKGKFNVYLISGKGLKSR